MTSVVAALLSAGPGGGGGLTDINLGLTLWTVVLFGVFAFVLGKFAWRPLLDLIEVRERTVREHVTKARRHATRRTRPWPNRRHYSNRPTRTASRCCSRP